MITKKSEEEIKIMREGGIILKNIIRTLKRKIKPGVSTEELNQLALELIKKYKAKPSFLGYNNFPKVICTSINEEVVHGVPGQRKLKRGDIVGLDVGILYKGMHTDAAVTYPVGEVSKEDKKLIDVTKKSLFLGLRQIREGKRIGDMSSTIQKFVEREGFSVVRACTGHGIGKDLHEDPSVPNFGEPKSGSILKEGYTLAIEPMVNAGDFKVKTLDDGWTITTCDGKKSSHFEFTVLVKKRGYENLTPIDIDT